MLLSWQNVNKLITLLLVQIVTGNTLTSKLLIRNTYNNPLLFCSIIKLSQNFTDIKAIY